ncbi:MAG: hypothetical protein E7251_13935 [Paenibacillaceae bacterium]|nr:hypothetical protein [Paenibacillaceae bacterium]
MQGGEKKGTEYLWIESCTINSYEGGFKIKKLIINRNHLNLVFPLSLIIWPWIFLFIWIPPFALIIYDIDFRYGWPPYFYSMLIGGVMLNFGNAIFLFITHKIEKSRNALFLIRSLSVITYPALAWGFLLSIFLLMGPEANKHILFLMGLSIITLNLSGTFYAVPLLLQLKKEQKISSLTAVSYTVFQFILGMDIITTFLIMKELKTLK